MNVSLTHANACCCYSDMEQERLDLRSYELGEVSWPSTLISKYESLVLISKHAQEVPDRNISSLHYSRTVASYTECITSHCALLAIQYW